MASLAQHGVDSKVTSGQIGRLTFTDGIAIVHLVLVGAPYGRYKVTGSGRARFWADFARDVFRLTGHDPDAAGVRQKRTLS